MSTRNFRPSLAVPSATRFLLPLLPWLLPLAPAQEQAGGVDAALRAFEEVRDRSEEQRAAVLSRLAPFAEPEVTDLLVAELGNARTAGYAEKVLRAIGSRPRPGVTRVLFAELVSPSVSAAVRRAAADALVAQGNRGVDVLAGILQSPPEEPPEGLRDVCLKALAEAGNDRAWRVLATVSLEGSPSRRLGVLQLMAPAGDVSAVTKARLAAATHEDLRLAATAFRQLAEQGHSRARVLGEDLHLRCGMEPPPAVRVQMIHGLAAALHPDLYRPLLSQSASANAAVRRAVRDVAPSVMENADFVRWLVETRPRTTEEERQAADAFLRSGSKGVAAEALVSMRSELRNPGLADLDLAVTLHLLLADDPTWDEDLLRIARSSVPELRAAGLSMLADRETEAGLPIALDSVDHREWPVRAAAYRFLSVVRSVEAVPLLIRRVGRETPRLEQDLLDTLMVTTGRRFWKREFWERWWKENRDDFVLPPPITMPGGSSSAGATVSYFNIPLVSSRAAYVIDTSGSMNSPIGTDRKRTRLDEAKSQLRRVLKAMPSDWMFNVIPYQSNVRPVLGGLQKARSDTVEEVVTAVDALRAGGGTNIHDALEKAFNDPDVDTIYLLSDGQPSVGPITQPDALADEVGKWNHSRQITIHCISVGMDSRFLQRLAKESGGTYVRIR